VRVDVHAHCYPRFYMKELSKIGAGDEAGVGVKVPVWESAEERIAEMDRLGVDVTCWPSLLQTFIFRTTS